MPSYTRKERTGPSASPLPEPEPRPRSCSDEAPPADVNPSCPPYSVPRLGERLIEKGLITQGQLAHALQVQSRGTNTLNYLGEILIKLGYVPSRQIGALLEEISGTPHVDLTTYPIDPAAVRLLPEEIVRQRLVFPLRADQEQVWLAMEDPLDLDTIDLVRLRTGRHVIPMLALLDELLLAINRAFDPDERQADNAPVLCPASLVIDAGFTNGASDIHLEPHEEGLRVRYRVDGVPREHRITLRANQAALVVFCCTSAQK